MNLASGPQIIQRGKNGKTIAGVDFFRLFPGLKSIWFR